MVLSDQIAEAHVVDVKWSPSKDGYLNQREINPISIRRCNNNMQQDLMQHL